MVVGFGSVREYDELMRKYDPRTNKTNPLITIYERANVLGLRAEQIARGARSLALGDSAKDHAFASSSTPVEIAMDEFLKHKTPLIVKRVLPDGAHEYWKIKDMTVF